MAIPFYEEEPAVANAASLANIADGDQVDGATSTATSTGYDEVDFEGPPTATTSSNTEPSTEEQLLAWKMLALTMCKVLKQFYQQQKQQQQPQSSTKLTAIVQIQPQTQQ